jgi:hypothetical protein
MPLATFHSRRQATMTGDKRPARAMVEENQIPPGWLGNLDSRDPFRQHDPIAARGIDPNHSVSSAEE